MNRRKFLKNIGLSAAALWMPGKIFGNITHRKPQKYDGSFKPTWASLANYETPEWYKNAKFGIWAHWGPQCEPEDGDWYARKMYAQGSEQYKEHLSQYGHPSKSGFKDVIHQWKAEKWNPEELVSLYKKAGAQYFMAMANHHDNFDNYDSKYQPWNSVKLGPGKDIIGGWAKAARHNNLPFGVSVHASHAWRFYENAQMSDVKGPLKGVPYDGTLTKADGEGTWWEGHDPQALYAQDHPLSKNNRDSIGSQWAWGGGACIPDEAYCQKFYHRTIDLIDKYDPGMVYFDDTVLPLYPISDVGLQIASYFYNKSINEKGQLSTVLTGKILDENQRKCMVWDIERGKSNSIQPFAWQTDTCIGNWHYDRSLYDNKGYKDTKTVIHSLVDIVSKNGNLMLNIPVRGNGTIDSEERKVVDGIARWSNRYGEGIFGTRPWDVYGEGEGPAQKDAAPLQAQGFNEGKGKPFTSQDIRFTQKGNTVYAFLMKWPADNTILIKSLGTQSEHAFNVQNVALVGGGRVSFQQRNDGLKIQLPPKPEINYAIPLRIA